MLGQFVVEVDEFRGVSHADDHDALRHGVERAGKGGGAVDGAVVRMVDGVLPQGEDLGQPAPDLVHEQHQPQRGVAGEPIFFASAQGQRLTDIDGNTYLDYIGSWGPMILGHRHPRVVAAVENALAVGTSYGAPTEAERRRSSRGSLTATTAARSPSATTGCST